MVIGDMVVSLDDVLLLFFSYTSCGMTISDKECYLSC